MSLTFVTAYLNIYENSPPLNRSDEWRLRHFRVIAESGVQLCVYVSPDCEEALLQFAQEFPNIKVMKPVKLSETIIAEICRQNPDYTLPSARFAEKDTVEYMQLQSSKTFFVQDAIQQNPWNSTHFAWIDFSIAYMFKNVSSSQKQLQILSRCALSPDFFAIPGCWGKWDVNRHDHHLEHIHWRFCGCFFIGSKDHVLRFCEEYHKRFVEFLQMTRKLIWEVNVWAWMEHVVDKSVWNPTWYDADHNDRCLLVNPDFLCGQLPNTTVYEYKYPWIEHN
jgi:hypothetical protein